MPRPPTVLAAVFVLLALPAMLVVVESVAYHAGNRNSGTIVSSGETRDYLLHVPASYDGRTPVPLVISLHGAAMWPAAQRDTSQWNRVADQHGFIVVYPSGLSGHGPRAWRADRGEGSRREARFIADLIDTLAASHNIDRARIYANGLSNGGGMAFALSCLLPDRIAAVGMVAAAHFLDWNWCPRPAVPMIAFHGTDDRATPYHGGTSWVSPQALPDIPTWTANGARHNQCAPAPIESAVTADVTRRAYANCAAGAAVELYTVRGGGHTWPGGGPLPAWFVGATSRSVDATALLWAFFREHPLVPR